MRGFGVWCGVDGPQSSDFRYRDSAQIFEELTKIFLTGLTTRIDASITRPAAFEHSASLSDMSPSNALASSRSTSPVDGEHNRKRQKSGPPVRKNTEGRL